MFRKFKNIFLFPEMDYHNYERINNKIRKSNLIIATILSTIATILISIMFILSFYFNEIKQNNIIYLVGLIISLILCFLSLTIAKKYSWIITLLIYLSFSFYYMFGIIIGAVLDPTGKTVTFMVLLVFLPIPFIVRPLHMIAVTISFVIIFIIFCLLNEQGTILSGDITDAIIFGFLGCASGTVVNNMKIKGFIFEQKLHEISRIDQLVQMKNRNAYEVEIDSIPNLCKYSLACVYIDVNGLHELNNEKGHNYGDKMLKHIANEVKNAFADELTYRIGGDEFIAFIPDKTEEDLKIMIHEMIEKIEMANYHVAVGYEIEKLSYLFLDNLIKTAESKMFRDKKQYYKNIANRETRNNN